MNSCGDAVVHFAVDLGKHVVVDGRGLLDIADSGCINDVPDKKALNCLVFGTKHA